MESPHPGERVNVTEGGAVADGIVFDTPSRTKVVVAVVDAGRGPVFRTVHPRALTDRAEEGAQDAVLRLLIRRTPPPVRGAEALGAGMGGRRAGHARGSMHRTTGK
jgi:hypothetical protein